MRILLAVTFIALGFCLSVALAILLGLGKEAINWFMPLSALASFGFGLALGHRIAERWWPTPSPLSVAELESLGRIRRITYRAVRVFRIEEFEDEGVHYVLELETGQVLYLQGQYLYDYEPDAYGVAAGVPRRFPCTEFDLLRDVEQGWAVEIDCRGTVLEPECTAPAPPRWPSDYEDGQVIENVAYEELKARFCRDH